MTDAPISSPGNTAQRFDLEIARQIWAIFENHGVQASPQHFELLHTAFSGQQPELTQLFHAHLQSGQPITANLLSSLYDQSCPAARAAETINDHAESLELAAEAVAGTITQSQLVLQNYSTALAGCTANLGPQPTLESLLQAVTALTTETARASERNRILERDLAASTSQVSKLRQDLTQFRQEATTDGLTGILNRRAFDAKLRKAIQHTKGVDGGAFSLLILDVDHFKRFNDTHGHRTGDQVLKLVGRVLSENIKGRDTAARYGGEEFAVLLIDADLTAASRVAEQICKRLSSQKLVKRGSGETVGQVTISIGVAQHQPNEPGAALIERADAALYEAKRGGRNRVCTALRNSQAA